MEEINFGCRRIILIKETCHNYKQFLSFSVYHDTEAINNVEDFLKWIDLLKKKLINWNLDKRIHSCGFGEKRFSTSRKISTNCVGNSFHKYENHRRSYFSRKFFEIMATLFLRSARITKNKLFGKIEKMCDYFFQKFIDSRRVSAIFTAPLKSLQFFEG